MERREPYNAVLEAAMGYSGACSVAVMDDVALVNEKVDKRDGGLGEEVVRVDGMNQELTEWTREFTDERARSGESDRFLRRERMRYSGLGDSLGRTVWGVRVDLAMR